MNNAIALNGSDKYGSMPANVNAQYVTYMPSIMRAPWAKLMIPITPKMSVSPMAMMLYIPPINRPSINDWMNNHSDMLFTPFFNLVEPLCKLKRHGYV